MRTTNKNSFYLFVMVLWIGILGSVGCGNGSGSDFSHPGERPNIIMIVVDTLRADHMSVNGYQRNTTPNLDEFSQNAYVFENAIAPAPWTVPSFVSLMTGMHAFNHNQNAPPDGTPVNRTMLPELLGQAGYETVFINANVGLQSYQYVFNEYYDYSYNTGNNADRLAIDKGIEWLNNEANWNHNFFLLIWLFSPHWPYSAQNGYLGQFVLDDLYMNSPPLDLVFDCNDTGMIYPSDLSPLLVSQLGFPPAPYECYQDYRLYTAAYDSEIKYVDAQIGRLLEFLRSGENFDDTMIWFTSDHGENMVDHEINFSHGDNLYHSLVHVPLFLKLSNQYGSMVVDTPIRLIDILPTVFDVLGLDPGEVDGKSLMPFVNMSPVDTFERPNISYGVRLVTMADMVSVTQEEYKLIRTTDGDELYDLIDDQYEQNNIATSYPDIVEDLSDYLDLFYP
jgi:arylsulfatase A-like enzyme